MSYRNNLKFTHTSTVTAPARQTISTTYTELTGSKCAVSVSGADLYYKYSFYISTIYDFADGSTGAYDKPFLHLKLQSSTDNFVSNIVDISGTEHNISGDTQQARDYYYRCQSVFFILENFTASHVRLVARAYSTSNEVDLHRARQWDGNNNDEVYQNTTLLVLEL